MGLTRTVKTGRLHHLEIWVADYPRAKGSLGWMLERVGYSLADEWGTGPTGGTFCAGGPGDVERLAVDAVRRGWVLLFADRHPFAGGAGHYAAYLEHVDGFEVELCALV